MVELRRRKQARQPASQSDTETDTEVNDGCDSDTLDDLPPVEKPKGGHSKGESKLGKVLKRLFFGTMLLFVLVATIAAGHMATLGLVVLVQVMMFRELVNVRYSTRTFKDLPLYRTQQWGWFASALVFTYGSSFLHDHLSLVKSQTIAQLLPFVEFISLILYSTMLILTVLTLKKGYYKYQMGQVAWTVTIVVITVAQVKSFTDNVLAGLFWFLFPVSLVICNDSVRRYWGQGCGWGGVSQVR